MIRVDRTMMPTRRERAKGWGLLLLSLGLCLAGCATASPEAVTLSEVVSGRVEAVQDSHEAFVRAYFDQSRERIEDFLVDQWIPEFLDQFLNDATGRGESLLQVLETVTPFDEAEVERLKAAFEERQVADPEQALAAAEDALGGGERGEAVLRFAEAAMEQIERKRRSLLDPIDDLEQRTLQELRSSYSQIQRAQASVSEHLRSLAKVQEEQDQFLNRIGLLGKRDELLGRAIAVNERVGDVLDAGMTVQETLRSLERALRSDNTTPEEANRGGSP